MRTFNHLYSTGNFTEPNLPYQSWLVIKRGLEPVREQEGIEDVLISHTHGKSKRERRGVARDNPMVPQSIE